MQRVTPAPAGRREEEPMRTLTTLLALSVTIGLIGCGDDVTEILSPEELSPPLGLRSITGDASVTLFWWCSNYGDDLVGYKVYMAEGSLAGNPQENVPSAFAVVDSLVVDPPCHSTRSIEIDGLVNGTTYSFLVVAVEDDDWNEISHTSNIVEDTPRAETAVDVTLYAYQSDPTQAGLELLDFSVVDCSDILDYNTVSGFGDIMIERFNPGAGMRAWIDGINDGWIQDLGYMADWDGADEAPGQGYAAAGHSIEALLGHVYAIWTGTDHFGKIQVLDIDEDFNWVRVKAAYQPAQGEPEYK
jgi:hypothetical protein